MRRVVKRARARRRRYSAIPAGQPDELFAEGLDLPVLLPGEVPRLRNPEWRGIAFYGPDGEPIGHDILAWAERMGATSRDPRMHLRSSFYRAGVHIDIRTDYVHGVDLSTGGPVPLPWETMIFIDGWAADAWRYATTAAARNGHRAVTAAVREQQRARRSVRRRRQRPGRVRL